MPGATCCIDSSPPGVCALVCALRTRCTQHPGHNLSSLHPVVHPHDSTFLLLTLFGTASAACGEHSPHAVTRSLAAHPRLCIHSMPVSLCLCMAAHHALQRTVGLTCCQGVRFAMHHPLWHAVHMSLGRPCIDRWCIDRQCFTGSNLHYESMVPRCQLDAGCRLLTDLLAGSIKYRAVRFNFKNSAGCDVLGAAWKAAGGPYGPS